MASSLLSGEYMRNKAEIDDAYQKALLKIKNDRGSLYTQFGRNENGTVDPNLKYGLLQQLERRYDSSRAQTSQSKDAAFKGYGITPLDAGGNWKLDPNGDGVLQRLQQDFSTTRGRIEDARNRLQSSTGLSGVFEGDKATGVSINEGQGQYQRLMENQAWNLDELRDSVGARGIGTSGLASLLRDRGETQAADQRSDFRSQVIDQLTQSKMAESDLTRQYGRSTEDIYREIQQMFNRFSQNDGDLSYQAGVDRLNLENSLQSSLSGLAEAEQQASFDRNNNTQSALMAELLRRIQTAGSAPTVSAAPSKKNQPNKGGAGTGNTRAM